MKKSLKDLLDKKDPREWSGGTRCSFCAHERRTEIDDDLRAAAAAKGRGSAIPWTYLYRNHFKPEYKLQATRGDSMLSHLQNCLKLKK